MRDDQQPGRETGRPPPSSASDVPELHFPDLPRLELDQLLGQLVERAQEVMATQGRLRGLLRANRVVTGDLAEPVVLRRVVQAARELVGARYAALGVIGPSGGLVDFVHEGMPDEALAQMEHLPQGKGLLGALIDEPRPIRLPHLAEDPRAAGFPPGHPPMDSFLGLPIRVRGEVFGNLYVTDSTRGDFTEEDEELLAALAGTAGVAIDNARLYQSARLRGEWLQASAAITRGMLGPLAEDRRSLELIADRTKEIADADLVLVLSSADDPAELRIEVCTGVDADHLRGQTLPVDGSLAGHVYLGGEPVALPHVTSDTGLPAVTSPEVEVGPVLAVPLTGSGRVHGVLTVARLEGRHGFTAADVDMVGSFANQAALAIELAEARRDQERAAMLDDRERIAADLHDHVIQRLFAAGLGLQTVAASIGPGRAADRLQGTIENLDDTIKQIRASIFALQQEPRTDDLGVRTRILDVVADVAPALGSEPGLSFSGLLEGMLPEDVIADLLAVLREALTNVARHAAAHAVEVEVGTGRGCLFLQVRDDGRGIGPTQRRSGLANLRRRAEARGGSLQIEDRVPSGTVLRWDVPLPS